MNRRARTFSRRPGRPAGGGPRPRSFRPSSHKALLRGKALAEKKAADRAEAIAAERDLEPPEECFCAACGHPPCSWCEGGGYHPELEEER